MRQTEYGFFIQDKSGLWHYQPGKLNRHLETAIQDALEYRPKLPALFWFHSIPAPMFLGDDPFQLLNRWQQWHEAYHRGAAWFLGKLIELPENRAS
ncbi:MAG: hypothetical protein HYZ63_00925 [Candidatus Andersenbacteria bacterium]|nr:hypothetical protein [Candidatus Andersenbacteria bacterium]